MMRRFERQMGHRSKNGYPSRAIAHLEPVERRVLFSTTVMNTYLNPTFVVDGRSYIVSDFAPTITGVNTFSYRGVILGPVVGELSAKTGTGSFVPDSSSPSAAPPSPSEPQEPAALEAPPRAPTKASFANRQLAGSPDDSQTYAESSSNASPPSPLTPPGGARSVASVGRHMFSTASLYAATLGTRSIKALALVPQKLAANLAPANAGVIGEQIVSAMTTQFPIDSEIPSLYHLRWPMLNQIDSIGQFIEQSATNFRQTFSTTKLGRAGRITMGILAADLILLGYFYRDCFFDPSRKRIAGRFSFASD